MGILARSCELSKFPTAKQTRRQRRKKDHFLTLFLDVAPRRASFADKEDADFSLWGSALHKTSLVCTDGSCVRSFLKTGQVYLYGALDTRGA